MCRRQLCKTTHTRVRSCFEELTARPDFPHANEDFQELRNGHRANLLLEVLPKRPKCLVDLRGPLRLRERKEKFARVVESQGNHLTDIQALEDRGNRRTFR